MLSGNLTINRSGEAAGSTTPADQKAWTVGILETLANYKELHEEMLQLLREIDAAEERYRTPFRTYPMNPEAVALCSRYGHTAEGIRKQLARVDAALARCKRPEVAEVLRRFYCEGQTAAAIAEAAYISIQTVNRWKSAGLDEIRKNFPE